MTETTTCACGAHPPSEGTSGVFPSGHGGTTCHIGGRWLDRAYFQTPAREFALALAAERSQFQELSQQHADQAAQLEADRAEIRRLEAALERWRTLALAQACVLAEDLQP